MTIKRTLVDTWFLFEHIRPVNDGDVDTGSDVVMKANLLLPGKKYDQQDVPWHGMRNTIKAAVVQALKTTYEADALHDGRTTNNDKYLRLEPKNVQLVFPDGQPRDT
jgi:hypothetical protein